MDLLHVGITERAIVPAGHAGHDRTQVIRQRATALRAAGITPGRTTGADYGLIIHGYRSSEA
jgi:hypothetical protein